MGAKGESETRLVFSILAVSSSSLIYWIIFAIIFDALKFPALFSFCSSLTSFRYRYRTCPRGNDVMVQVVAGRPRGPGIDASFVQMFSSPIRSKVVGWNLMG